MTTVMHRASPHRRDGHVPFPESAGLRRRSIITRMRINLVTPFAEKDAAKSLGARWDSAQKTWYITNVADLTPFLRWIADADTATATATVTAPSVPRGPAVRTPNRSSTATAPGSGGTVTSSTIVVLRCGCAVLPWEPCQHN